ncbi:MAG TPA: molybdopterin-dependent oxidoreductase [Bryobacteraceae bacterium]|jgi:DMSO/TMAO reductase YedYZ molybdopterin-dependent catalytic subunit
MEGNRTISRRSLLKGGSAAGTALTVMHLAGPGRAFGQSGEKILPWLDQPAANPIPANVGNLLQWESLDSWLTPANDFFFVKHFEMPTIDPLDWRLRLEGLMRRPRTLNLEELQAYPRVEVDFTLECSGNNGTGLDFFIGGVGNAHWGGTRLAPLLEQSGLLDHASEVVFWGADSGASTIRDNSGIVNAGQSGTGQPDSNGGIDLTITEQFARSMSLADALNRDNLLCYEMNGGPLPAEHGSPVRLIAPGWYGVANVKWLTRIEVIDHRYAGRFMARDYVSIRETQQGDQTRWTFTTVGRNRLKSAPAKVVRKNGRYSIMGVAWGGLPAVAVEVQIDNGPWLPATWTPATLDKKSVSRDRWMSPHADSDRWDREDKAIRPYAWKFWTLDWGAAPSGEHRIRSRAIDIKGNVQPPPDDPFLASRRTYWESNGQITRRVLIP